MNILLLVCKMDYLTVENSIPKTTYCPLSIRRKSFNIGMKLQFFLSKWAILLLKPGPHTPMASDIFRFKSFMLLCSILECFLAKWTILQLNPLLAQCSIPQLNMWVCCYAKHCPRMGATTLSIMKFSITTLSI
jgi:hypothetical protein